MTLKEKLAKLTKEQRDELIAELGLAPDADRGDILAAIEALKASTEGLGSRLAELEKLSGVKPKGGGDDDKAPWYERIF